MSRLAKRFANRYGAADTGRISGVVRRHRPDYQLVLYMGILVLVGLVVLFAISPARVEMINGQGGNNLDQAHFMQKQVLYLGAGLTAFAVAASMPLAVWKRLSGRILLLGLGVCLLLSFLGLFMDGGLILKSGGATRWFNIGPGTFQPAELLKFGLWLFVAAFLARRMAQGKLSSPSETLLPLALPLALAIILVVGLQKDMGTGITLVGIVASMIIVSGMKLKAVVPGAAALLIVGGLFVAMSPHRLERVATFMNPGAAGASLAQNYHINMASIAIGSGGFFGKGLGESIQAFGYLPEAVNDSIFAILGETFGFVGLIAIMSVFVALLWRIMRISEHVQDPFLRMLAAGGFGWLATHVVVNIGAMTGIFPLTGVTLPFLSFGGTSLLFTMLVLGILMQVSRYTSHQVVKQEREAGRESTYSGRRIGRARYADTRRIRRA